MRRILTTRGTLGLAVLLGLATAAQAGLVAEYLMEEGVGTLVGDTSGQGNNAGFDGAPVWVAGHDPCSEYALYFDGDDYLVANDSASLDSITTGFTVTAWINCTQNSIRDTIVWKLGAFRVWKSNANLMASFDGVATVTNYTLVTGQLPNDTWVHVAVAYDGRYIVGYINGVRKHRVRVNNDYIPIDTSDYPLHIGWYGSVPNYRGSLDNVRLYNHRLTDGEVVVDMNDNSVPGTEPLDIVSSGVGMTAIIYPDGGDPAAAEELQYHIEQATGAVLSLHQEAGAPGGFDGLIYVGNCDTTAAAGIDGSALGANGYVIRNVGPDLFLAGDDSAGPIFGDLHTNDTRVGTLLAVYRFIEDNLDVQWLWPGPSGEIIPTRTDLVAANINITDKPTLMHTRMRDWGVTGSWGWGSYGNGSHDGWSSGSARDTFLENQSRWMRRHGFCQGIDLDYGHSYVTWWDTYGVSNPEYFNELPDGTRRPDPYWWNAPSLIAMCMAQPALHDKIVTDWIAGGANSWINVWKNDTGSKCVCDLCMAWDVEPNDFEATYGYPWANRLTEATARFNAQIRGWESALGPMSDRYAKFILAIQQEAASRGYPDVITIGGAYANRTQRPIETPLNDRVRLGMVTGGGFPWPESTQQASRDLWSDWTDWAGVQAYLRPNYLYYCHNMPTFTAHRMGSDFLHHLRRGMFGTDFDSLVGQFSTQAPTMYVMARMQTHVNPSPTAWGADLTADCAVGMDDFLLFTADWLADPLVCATASTCADLDGDGDVDAGDFAIFAQQFSPDSCREVEALLDEFYSAFGPAENSIRDYYNHWRTVSDNATVGGDYTDFYMTAGPATFTPTVMATGRALMTAAQQAAQGNASAERLVGYLEQGLTNAELTLAAQEAWDTYTTTGVMGPWTVAIDALDAYRAHVDPNGVGEMGWLRAMENYNWLRGGLPNIPVTGGQLYGVTGDSVSDDDIAGDRLIWFHDNSGDGTIYVVLDVGSAQPVDIIKFFNTDYAASNYHVDGVDISVAPDESAPGFAFTDIPSYTTAVYSGSFLPQDTAAGVERQADITNVTKRYFLIAIKSNFWGLIGPTQTYAWGGDMDIQ